MDDLFIFEELGEGGFGLVKKAYHKRAEKYVAMKFLNEKMAKSEKFNEFFIQQKLEDHLLRKIEEINIKHNNVFFLKYDGAFKDPSGNMDALVLQMESGIATLADLLKAGKVYDNDELLYVLYGLIQGFTILQMNGISHRDVKPENIVLVEDENCEGKYYYKISDYGAGYELPLNDDLIKGETWSAKTPQYLAPELDYLVDENLYNPYVADVFSLGVLTLQMINYKFTKEDLEKEKDLFKDIRLIDTNQEILVLLKKMLEKTPQKRFDFKRLNEYFINKFNKKILNFNTNIKVKNEMEYLKMS